MSPTAHNLRAQVPSQQPVSPSSWHHWPRGLLGLPAGASL